VRIRGEEALRGALDAGKGVLVVSAHLGSPELGALALARIRPVHTVAGIQWCRRWSGAVAARLARHGVFIHRGPLRLRTLLRALQRGEIVALQMDGDQATAASPSWVGEQPVRLARGPAWLASRGFPTLAGACLRDGGGWQLHLRPLASPGPGADAGDWHRYLEEEIRRWIEAWRPQWILQQA
jgi:KDO2-lipid IV(A) lauroyltransferase